MSLTCPQVSLIKHHAFIPTLYFIEHRQTHQTLLRRNCANEHIGGSIYRITTKACIKLFYCHFWYFMTYWTTTKVGQKKLEHLQLLWGRVYIALTWSA